MKVKQIREWLSQFEDEEEVVLTSMDDKFLCGDFELHSKYNDGQAQEIIIPCFFDEYKREV